MLETKLRRPWAAGRRHGASVITQEEDEESELFSGRERKSDGTVSGWKPGMVFGPH